MYRPKHGALKNARVRRGRAQTARVRTGRAQNARVRIGLAQSHIFQLKIYRSVRARVPITFFGTQNLSFDLSPGCIRFKRVLYGVRQAIVRCVLQLNYLPKPIESCLMAISRVFTIQLRRRLSKRCWSWLFPDCFQDEDLSEKNWTL